MTESSNKNKFIESFSLRYKNSKDKRTLLEKEINEYESLFNCKSVFGEWDFDYVPDLLPSEFSFPLDAYYLRKAYEYFVVNGNDLSTAGEWYNKVYLCCKTLEEAQSQGLFWANDAIEAFEYLNWLKSTFTTESNFIIKPEHIGLIYDHFSVYFEKETRDKWLIRFNYPKGSPIEPIIIEKEAREDSDRLVLLAILSSIQKTTRNKYRFNDFVLERFGIMNYSRAKTEHKNKETYKKIVKECDLILKK